MNALIFFSNFFVICVFLYTVLSPFMTSMFAYFCKKYIILYFPVNPFYFQSCKKHLSQKMCLLIMNIAGFHLKSWRPFWCALKRISIISFVWDTKMAAISTTTTIYFYSVKENSYKIITTRRNWAKLVEAGCDIIYIWIIYFDSPLDWKFKTLYRSKRNAPTRKELGKERGKN